MACTAFTERRDFLDYRPFRLARNQDQQLTAIKNYLNHQPDGHWSREIEEVRDQLEPRVFETNKGNRQGLRYYLRFYPHGTFAEQARERLKAFKQINRGRARERERSDQLTQQRQALDEQMRRTWVSRFFDHWFRVFLSVENWGAPIEQVARENPVFSRAFADNPRPVCTPELCTKSFRNSYAIPVPSGTRFERSVELQVRLQIKQGRLKSAQIVLLKNGFSRWFELENAVVSNEDDEAARQKAVSWTQNKIKSILEEANEGKIGENSPLQGGPKVFSTNWLQIAMFAIKSNKAESQAEGVEIKPLGGKRAASDQPRMSR